MNRDRNTNEPAFELPGMNLGALVDASLDERTIRQIQSISSAVTIFSAAAEYPKHDSGIKNLANQLLTGQIDMVVFLTGTGLSHFVDRCVRNVCQQRLLDMLNDISSVAVGTVATNRLKQHGITPTFEIADPFSWRDIIVALDKHCQLTNLRIGLETGKDIHSLSAGLEARGAAVVRIDRLMFEQADPSASEQDLLDAIEDQQLDAILLPNVPSASRYVHLIQHRNRKSLRECTNQLVTLVMGNETAELLGEFGMSCDMVISDELASILPDNIRVIHEHKEKSRAQLSGPATSIRDTSAPWYDCSFIRAIRREPYAVTPIWLPGQAGRYMKEFRDARRRVSFLQLCKNPQLCSELACFAVQRLGVDAAVIVSDTLPLLEAMGCQVEYVENGRPIIGNPIQSESDVQRIRPLDSTGSMEFVMDTVRQTRSDLPDDIPLIGFAIAPFTLASYMIDGGFSRYCHRTKTFFYRHPVAWQRLMEGLMRSVTNCLVGQIQAGAQCVQLIDSRAGCLAYDDYVRYVHNFVSAIVGRVSRLAPVIICAPTGPGQLPLLAETEASVIGVDWRIRLDHAWATVGYHRALQGNLDPAVLLSDSANIRLQAQNILNQAENRPGHIFSLGQAVLPQTPVENVIALVDAVHELSQNGRASS